MQDRVVQAYEGLVAMDFDKDYFDAHGHGIYEVLPPARLHAALPLLFLAYDAGPEKGDFNSSV